MRAHIVFLLLLTVPGMGLAQAPRPATAPSTRPTTRATLTATAPQRGGGIFGAIWGRGRSSRPSPPSFDAIPENLKAQLGSTDEEWKVINPMLRKVILAKQLVEPDLDNPVWGRTAPPERFWDSGNPFTEAKKELQSAVANRETPADQLDKKVQAYRRQRDAAREQLKAARENLRELLTVDQEAVLVELGYLE